MSKKYKKAQKHYKSAYPYFSRTQRKEILKCTQSILKGEEMLTMGNAVREFEAGFAAYCGTKYAIATNSCTSALNVVLRELGLGAKDEVIVPTQTFFANASSVLNSGAKLQLVETDKDFMLTSEIVESAITPHTKAVVLVHFAGLITQDIFKIKALCKKHTITLIEDCSHAHGAIAVDSKGRAYKAGNIGDISVFSFFSTKILTCGEGGMIMCNDKDFADKCRARANRGLDSKAQGEHFISLGENYRMAEFNAILGLVGLESLEANLAYRNKLATLYKDCLSILSQKNLISFQVIPNGFRHSFWRFIVFLTNHTPQSVIQNLKAHHIYADAPYQPLLHKQPLLQKLHNKVAIPLHSTTPQNHISLPMHLSIKAGDVKFISKKLKEILL
ncbi:DegT/DnrJ/EryC1/StrS family aminotransferase [Helicobacter cinaedi]|uniref:DegT/DnrJ/EryC1/StrS aminotransferase n=1 Tax=Helicobacter cinaedi CCUG 18818 = ATCC BAA-847 TaxID=537971 RepID=A0AAI8QFX1_9HELI|nr:DegT/DnrJ/EryC1/StrS family aminotransferase [Helicobacter cinaedi]EFR46594.1 DegT/DnrJ/EryC1/StrS aminotransferase family protein [Helicobacter cinaedi CCUG 18818 = ATCC BAA-847]QOQ89856.1 DegT/DnrJ/EryC1/StrS family aminotransferase [Helicobacter cinaedi]BAM32051.1 DegT/DnrJ/EryC1/StrS aminotransferase [Helicobacter cinaedi CCUG 18818 = ATCC BAA-847]